MVVTLLAHGCPIQAIVVAFGLDERTVAVWLKRAGEQCQRVQQLVSKLPEPRTEPPRFVLRNMYGAKSPDL